MSDTPSLRNVVVEQFHQFLTCFTCNIVSPCTERYKKFTLFVERHISMHHGADTECTYRFQFYVIFCFYIFCHILIAVLDTCPDIFQTVCPDTVLITVFPLMCAGSDRLVFVIYEYCFDSCGTEFNTKCCFVCKDCCFCFCCSHFMYLPVSLLFIPADHVEKYDHICSLTNFIIAFLLLFYYRNFLLF